MIKASYKIKKKMDWLRGIQPALKYFRYGFRSKELRGL